MITVALYWLGIGTAFWFVRGHGKWNRVVAIWPLYALICTAHFLWFKVLRLPQ